MEKAVHKAGHTRPAAAGADISCQLMLQMCSLLITSWLSNPRVKTQMSVFRSWGWTPEPCEL